MLLILNVIFQTSVPFQVQLCACCSAGILHGALCHSRGFQAPSDAGASEIAARELCLELPCELVSSSFTSPGQAEQNPNLTPLLEYHLGQTGREAQISPRIHRARHSHSSLQGLLTRAWNSKDLKIRYRIYSTFLLYLP